MLGRSTASTGAIEEITVGSGLSLSAGSLTATGGGSETNTWALPSAASNPSSPYTLSSITGSTVQRITGLAGDLTINKPTFSGSAPSGRTWVLFQIAAVSATRTITFGSGISHDGIGAAPTFTVASGGLANILLYTDDGGTTWKYPGDYDFATNKAAVLAALLHDLGKASVAFQKRLRGELEGQVAESGIADRVRLLGFGKFSTVERSARQGKNPSTGETIQIAAKTTAKITPLKGFKDVVLGAAPPPKLG